MSQKIIIPLLVLVIVSLSIIIINEVSSKTNKQFDINNQDDLSQISFELSQQIIKSKTYLSSLDIVQLLSSDPNVDLITFDPNDMNGWTGGKGTYSTGYNLRNSLPDGTRTFEEHSLNGTLLKSITIHDVPEKRITIILK